MALKRSIWRFFLLLAVVAFASAEAQGSTEDDRKPSVSSDNAMPTGNDSPKNEASEVESTTADGTTEEAVSEDQDLSAGSVGEAAVRVDEVVDTPAEESRAGTEDREATEQEASEEADTIVNETAQAAVEAEAYAKTEAERMTSETKETVEADLHGAAEETAKTEAEGAISQVQSRLSPLVDKVLGMTPAQKKKTAAVVGAGIFAGVGWFGITNQGQRPAFVGREN